MQVSTLRAETEPRPGNRLEPLVCVRHCSGAGLLHAGAAADSGALGTSLQSPWPSPEWAGLLQELVPRAWL